MKNNDQIPQDYLFAFYRYSESSFQIGPKSLDILMYPIPKFITVCQYW